MSSGVLGNTQLELSGIEHKRRRNLYGRHLVGKVLDRRGPIIERLAAEMIATWFEGTAPAGAVEGPDGQGWWTVELGLAFANEFPSRVVGQVLGFPDEASADFFYWYSSMMNGLGGSDTAGAGVQARQDLEDYVAEHVAERRERPTYLHDGAGDPIGKDIISELCATRIDGDLLPAEEVTSNIALVVGGGGETTRGAILNLWYLLLQHPHQLAAVRADPSLWDAAFHEALRHSSSIGGQPRHNSWDIELHGVQVPAGSLMRMVDFSANHDERVFADPERFDVVRPELYSGKIAQRAIARTVGPATWRSASAHTFAPGPGSAIRKQRSGRRSSPRRSGRWRSLATGCRRTSTAPVRPRSGWG